MSIALFPVGCHRFTGHSMLLQSLKVLADLVRRHPHPLR